jgi:APA family basic amino acid/polyamine antiporter
MNGSNDQTQPKQTLSLLDVTAIIIGIVIGSGIFVFPTFVASNASSGTNLILFWIAGGFISIIGALVYAELATTYPHAGGDYHFLQIAYGNDISFLFAWARMMIIQPGAIVMMAFVIGGELSSILSLGKYSASIYAVLTVILLTGTNMFGIREGKWAQKILTGGILIGLLSLIVIGLLAIVGVITPELPAAAEAAAAAPASSGQDMAKLGVAMIFVLFAYSGWNESAYVSAEVKEPQRNIIKALLLGLGVVTILYVIINLVYVQVLGLGVMASNMAPHKLVEVTLGPGYRIIVNIIITLAALSTTNATIITGGRSNYALGKDYKLFKFMGTWKEESGTPFKALIFQALICFLLIVLGSLTVGDDGSFRSSGINAMIEYTTPAFYFFFLMIGISLFVLRKMDEDKPRVFNVPLYPVVPLLFICTCVFLLQSSLSYHGKNALVSVLVILAGLPVMLLNRFISKN